jgi:hypothetical protein
LKSPSAAISFEVELNGEVDVLVMPSVQLTALPRKTDELNQDQYWAPFDLDSAASTNKWQQLTNHGKPQRRTVRLVPSRLSWAKTKSSTWPSQAFSQVVPPGDYSLQVKLDTRDYKATASNEVTVTIVK